MSENTPIWAKNLTKKVDKMQSCINGITENIKIVKKEIPILRVRIDTLCSSAKNNETHLNQIENKIKKIEKKL